jgi:hypothetical protein
MPRPPDHDGIAGADKVEHRVQRRPVLCRTGDLVHENAVTASGCQSVALQRIILLKSGHPGEPTRYPAA